MREILFRGKRVEEPIKISPYAPDGWVYGGLIECDDGCFILPYDISGEMYIDGPYKFRANDVEARIMLANVGIETVGQYTGLTDKNGTKIFEGDIAKIFGMVGKIICECGAFGIAFDDCIDYKKLDNFTQKRIGNNFSGVCCDNFISLYEVYWNLNNLDECLHEVEVIGNIYDNPELLKGE